MLPTVSAFSIATAGAPVPITDLPLSPEEIERLPRLGQTHIHIGGDSSELMVEAARKTLEASGRRAEDIGLVISAPSLLTAHGLVIPAAAVRARLGLTNVSILNIQQGCVGVLKAFEVAAERIRARPEGGDVLVVTGCMASTLTTRSTHGAFFWSDGAGAALVGMGDRKGFALESVVEATADAGYDAMTVPFGDAWQGDPADPSQLRIEVKFRNTRERVAYIDREGKLFSLIVDRLLASRNLQESAVDAVIMPATGVNRIPTLLGPRPALKDKVVTDFQRGHMGGVDILVELDRLWTSGIADGAVVVAAMPAFTTQWAGALLRCRR